MKKLNDLDEIMREALEARRALLIVKLKSNLRSTAEDHVHISKLALARAPMIARLQAFNDKICSVGGEDAEAPSLPRPKPGPDACDDWAVQVELLNDQVSKQAVIIKGYAADIKGYEILHAKCVKLLLPCS